MIRNWGSLGKLRSMESPFDKHLAGASLQWLLTWERGGLNRRVLIPLLLPWLHPPPPPPPPRSPEPWGPRGTTSTSSSRATITSATLAQALAPRAARAHSRLRHSLHLCPPEGNLNSFCFVLFFPKLYNSNSYIRGNGEKKFCFVFCFYRWQNSLLIDKKIAPYIYINMRIL